MFYQREYSSKIQVDETFVLPKGWKKKDMNQNI